MKGRNSKVKEQIEKLRAEIRRHDYCYYILNQPEISDKEYDDLMYRLQVMEKENPQLVTMDSLRLLMHLKMDLKILTLGLRKWTKLLKILKRWNNKIDQIKINWSLAYM